MARKKKSVANPARGFATTSVASKPKPERSTEPDVKTPKKEVQAPAVAVSTSVAPTEASAPAKAAAPTPEELEAQLERDELQLLAEKHAAKVRRDSRRQVTRFQTDQRVLRPQSEPLTVSEWLPGDIIDKIIALAHIESNDSNRRQGQHPLLKVLSEEEAMSKLWALELTLRDMGFSVDHIEAVLQYICANAADIDTSAGIWGFQEALEWLALNLNEEHAFSFEETKTRHPLSGSAPTSRPPSPGLQSETATNGPKSESPSPAVATAAMHPGSDSGSGEPEISDLESDIEPDEIVPTYLKIKARLFDIDPDAVDASVGKPRKKPKGPGPTKKVESPAVRKLRSQLQQLQSDALFNQDEADALWPARRNQIAQAKAADKRVQSASDDKTDPSPPPRDDDTSSKIQEAGTSNDDDEVGMLGDMFAAAPDEVLVLPTAEAAADNIIVKDFGKQTGVSPKRILEEAIRAR
jgi:ATP-dependent RNA helicase DHX29